MIPSHVWTLREIARRLCARGEAQVLTRDEALDRLHTAYEATLLRENNVSFAAACENPVYLCALINLASELDKTRR